MQYFADLIICIEDGGHQPSAEGKKVEVKGAQRFIYILMWCIAKNCSYLGVRGTFFHFEWPGKESGCVERRVNYNTYLRCQSIGAKTHLLPKTLQIYYKSVALKSFFVSKTRTRFDLPSNTWGCIASFHLFMLECEDLDNWFQWFSLTTSHLGIAMYRWQSDMKSRLLRVSSLYSEKFL